MIWQTTWHGSGRQSVSHAPQSGMRNAPALDSGLRGRLRGDKAFLGGVLALSLIAVLPLVLILVFIIVRGASSINWHSSPSCPSPWERQAVESPTPSWGPSSSSS